MCASIEAKVPEIACNMRSRYKMSSRCWAWRRSILILLVLLGTVEAVIVRSAVRRAVNESSNTSEPSALQQPGNIERVKPAAAYRLPCTFERPHVIGQTSNSLQLYLLDPAGLHRIEVVEDGNIVRALVSTLPKRYEEAKMLQVLDINLAETDHVLFVVTTDQWHNVFLAHRNPSTAGASAQPAQRIKYSGTMSKARLLECNGNIYLVTIVTYVSTGKIRVYRWQQSYFSLESTKEVQSVDDVQCHCPSTLLLLVLDYAPVPERSLNHVLLLDSAERPVKVQEMFFLYNSLPSFMLDGELYLIRRVSKDKSYLYQWSSESRFVRLRKLSDPSDHITTITHWDSTLAVAFEQNVRLYGSDKQHLLRAESSFTVYGVNSSEPLTQLNIASDGESVSRLLSLRTGKVTEVALAVEFDCPATGETGVNGTALKIYHLTISSVARSAEGIAHEQGFRTLNSCLHQLKQELNERKKWIDLIRIQLSHKNLVPNAITQHARETSTLLHPTVQIDSVTVAHDSSNLLPPTRTALNAQSLLLRHYRVATDLNQVLLLNRARTEIQGDLHVVGNVRTRCSKIRAVNAMNERTSDDGLDTLRRRTRGSVRVMARIPYRMVKAKEVLFDPTVGMRFLSRSKMNVLPGSMELNELSTESVRLEQGAINHIPVPSRRKLQDAAEHGYRGHKLFRTVKSFRLNAHHLNGQPLSTQIIESGLGYASDGITIKSAVCRTRNLLVRNTLNGLRLQDLASTFQRTVRVQGNLVLAGEVCVKNLQFQHTLNNVPRTELLDRVSNQTITGPVLVSKGFTHSLQVQRVNGEPLTNYATIAQPSPAGVLPALTIKAPVRVEKTIIRRDLIANHEEQQFAPHIGTSPGDFRQLYTGKVLLNGSLRLKVANIGAPNVTLMGRTVTSKPYQQYLLRTQRQVLDQPNAYHTAQFQYLFANTLNGVGLWQFSLTHRNWQNSLYLQDAIVQGPVRPARISKRLHSVQQDRVDLNANVRVCDAKRFTGTLRVSNLHVHSLGGVFEPKVLWRREAHHNGTAVAGKAFLGRTVLQNSLLHVRTPPRAANFNGRPAYALSRATQPPPRRCHTLRLAAATAASVTVRQVAGLPLGSVLQRFAGAGRHASTSRVPSSARIKTPTHQQHIGSVTVDVINACPVDRLLRETVPRHAADLRPVAGHKHVQGPVHVPGQLAVHGRLNAHHPTLFGHLVTRGPTARPQTIDARWRLGRVTAGYLTAKQLNRASLGRLASRASDDPVVLHDELLIDQLHLATLSLPDGPSPAWAFEPPRHVRAPSTVGRLRCYGHVHGAVRALDPTRPLHQLLHAPSLDRTRTIAGPVVFTAPSVHFDHASTAPGTDPPALERIARRCLRRALSSPPGQPATAFTRDQTLHCSGPHPVTVRGHLAVADGGWLSGRSVAGVPLADRLGPSADLYRPAGPPASPHHPIVGRKRFRSVVSAHNVALGGPAGVPRWSRLALCADPANPCDVALRLTHPCTVRTLLTADRLNRVPLDGFFHAFARRRSGQPGPTPIQDLADGLTVADLRLAGPGTILHQVNGIPLGEVVMSVPPNATHQVVPGPKHFRVLRLDGPVGLRRLNGRLVGPTAHASLPSDQSPHPAIVLRRQAHLPALHTHALHHSRTGTTRLVAAPAGHLALGPLPVPHRSPALREALHRTANARSGTPDGEVVPVAPDGGPVRLRCTTDHRSLVVELRRHPTETRRHELPESADGCFRPAGTVALNRTTLLVLLDGTNRTRTVYRYELGRGRLTSLTLPSPPGPVCRHVRLLRPPGSEPMLAVASCTDAPNSRTVRIYRVDVLDRMLQLQPFQTIGLAEPLTSLDATEDGAELLLLLLSDDPTQTHRYTYSSVQGWTRDDHQLP